MKNTIKEDKFIYKFSTEFGNSNNDEFKRLMKSGDYKVERFSIIPNCIRKEVFKNHPKVNGNSRIIYSLKFVEEEEKKFIKKITKKVNDSLKNSGFEIF